MVKSRIIFKIFTEGFIKVSLNKKKTHLNYNRLAAFRILYITVDSCPQGYKFLCF